ncbi:hypothetical protein CNR22_12070 [Sphingobacteriaceae bacterium]|nr:hypothetical protein CNR22_12070 [Sphingobacteriaceae bacterium]
MKKQIRIGIADDHKIVIDGLVAILSTYENMKVVFTASNGQELLKKMTSNKVDVILLDLDMPVVSGHEAFTTLKRDYPELKIIILSSNYNFENVAAYFKKGTNAFLPKDCDSAKLVQAITDVYFKGKYADADVADMLVQAASRKPVESEFSERELKIIRLICEDKTTKEIADTLSLSVRTVEYDRSLILARIDGKSVASIIKYAIQNKIVEM